MRKFINNIFLVKEVTVLFFNFPRSSFSPHPPVLSLSLFIPSSLPLWFYYSGETTQGSNSRGFFLRTMPLEQLNLVQDFFTTFSPKGVDLMCHPSTGLWRLQCLCRYLTTSTSQAEGNQFSHQSTCLMPRRVEF